jgi:hypothetical protein
MRRTLRSIIVMVPLVTALGASAQEGIADKAKERLADDESGDSSDSSDSSDTADSPGYGGEDSGGPAEGGDTPSTAPESYAVQPGDTLWGLSQRFLNNPWYWPKIWSYNPQLDNPNWIRPGTVLRFYPGQAVEEEPEQEAPVDDLGEGGGFEDRTDLDARNDKGSDSRRREFFIPGDRLDDAGQITNSPEEKQLLATDDRTYIKLKKQAQPGQVLQIFRKERELRHPVTGSNVGQIVTMVGEVRVDQTGREQSLGTVVSAWDPIERGLFVAELPVNTEAVRKQDNTKTAKGYVVDAAPNPLSFLGDNYMVIVDKGSQDGVQPGNTFVIVRAGDPYTREYSGMADEDIGELMIIETFKGASTAILTAASRIIVPGDRIEMRTR